MLAKQLSHVLRQLSDNSDVITDSAAEMEERFESLRAYGRLPRGRENRGVALTDTQIVAGVLGLVASRPGWTGHVCAVIEKLKPVGGVTEKFGNAATLTDALVHILNDEQTREAIVAVRLSVAESGKNSNGRAVITYDLDGSRQTLSFVRNEAVSLLQPKAEERFDPESRYAEASREFVLNRRFFQRLVRSINDARAYPSPPIGDGSEYDREDAETARRKRLGVTPSSFFLNIGVDNQVTWPNTEMLIDFDRYKLVLMPKTKDNVQSVHLDLHTNRVSMEEGMTVINRFLSLLTWCDDQFAIAQGGWAGNPVPVAVSKRDLAFATAHAWLFNRTIPEDSETQRALALYREARNAEQNFMISYAVLNYYKIIEIHHKGQNDSRKWVADNLPAILDDANERESVKTFLEACGEESPELYIYAACRVAVAHVSPNRPSDPDDTIELRRLHNAADIMRMLARRFISVELGLSDTPYESATASS